MLRSTSGLRLPPHTRRATKTGSPVSDSPTRSSCCCLEGFLPHWFPYMKLFFVAADFLLRRRHGLPLTTNRPCSTVLCVHIEASVAMLVTTKCASWRCLGSLLAEAFGGGLSRLFLCGVSLWRTWAIYHVSRHLQHVLGNLQHLTKTRLFTFVRAMAVFA